MGPVDPREFYKPNYLMTCQSMGAAHGVTLANVTLCFLWLHPQHRSPSQLLALEAALRRASNAEKARAELEEEEEEEEEEVLTRRAS